MKFISVIVKLNF